MQFCTIAGNSTSANGGGIANRDNGTITLEYSTVSNNTAINGAGIFTGGTIFTSASATTELLDSTIAENIATRDGGAIDVISGQASVVYGTIALNTASTGGGIDILSGSSLAMQSSIVAGNSAMVGPNIVGILTTDGYNLIQNASSVTFNDPFKVHSTDISGGTLTDLKIDSVLKANGGPTETLALLPGSPAIDRIPLGVICGQGSRYNILNKDIDQRGVTRPQGVGCDLGAYERK